jgi:Trk K+ transport system NAD-binding subunit
MGRPDYEMAMGFTGFLARWRWPLTGVAALVAAVLGATGLLLLFSESGQPTPLDVGYHTLQLFFFKYGFRSIGPLPWQLEVARFLAPATTALATFGALTVLFRDQIQRIGLRFASGHVVICGLGAKGLRLVRDFRANGDRVVVIEKDGSNGDIPECTRMGVPVLVGDARNLDLLHLAGIVRASVLVSVCEDDGVNVDVAVRAHQFIQQRPARLREPLKCFLHIVDLGLCSLLKQHRLFGRERDRLDVRVFNTYVNSARQLQAEFSLERDLVRTDDPRTVQFVVVGLGRLGESVALQAAKTSHFANARKLELVLIDRYASDILQRLEGRHPGLSNVCEVSTIDGDICDARVLERIRALSARPDRVTSIAICIDQETQSLATSMNLLGWLRDQPVPILVRMTRQHGLSSLLGADATAFPGKERLHLFGILSRTCTRDLLLTEMLDRQARAVQKQYVESCIKRGLTADKKPAMRPWEDLDENFRDSCRQQADHLSVKLRAIGWEAVPMEQVPTESIPPFPQSVADIEKLARMEHNRWMSERLLAGWRLGQPATPEEGNQRKISPYLVPYDQLPPGIQNYDREAVGTLPILVELAGMRLQPRKA